MLHESVLSGHANSFSESGRIRLPTNRVLPNNFHKPKVQTRVVVADL